MMLRAVPDRPPRAVAYIRVSDEGGRGEDLMSPQIQLAAIRDYCQRRGYEIVRVLEDIDLTGRFWKRRQVETAIAMIEAREAEVVCVWKISRVARNRLDWAIAVDRVEKIGGQLESATEPIDTRTSTGRFTRGVLAELAAFESERIGEGWREAHGQRVGRGLPSNGRVPWGWVAQKREIHPHPVHGPVVAELYRRYIQGMGGAQLADYLNQGGWPTEKGGRWHPTTVRYLLDNPVHAGFIVYKGDVVEGAHDGIISRETWELYQAQRRDRRRAGRLQSTPHLLSGLLVCGRCGFRMCVSGGKKAYPVYRCDHAISTKAHRWQSVSVRRVDAKVMDWLAALAPEIAEAARSEPEPASVAADTLRIESSITDLDRQLVKLTEHLVSGLVPEVAYEAARDSITQRRDQLGADLRAASDRRVLAADIPDVQEILDNWGEMAMPAKRAILRSIIREVTLIPGPEARVTITPVWE
jgi:DNA invertase Pin-like site-specific DNA recombinase